MQICDLKISNVIYENQICINEFLMNCLFNLKIANLTYEILKSFNEFYKRTKYNPVPENLPRFLGILYSIEPEFLKEKVIQQITIECLTSIQFYFDISFSEYFDEDFFDFINNTLFGNDSEVDYIIGFVLYEFIMKIPINNQFSIFIKDFFRNNITFKTAPQLSISFYEISTKYPEACSEEWMQMSFFSLLQFNEDPIRVQLFRALYKMHEEYLPFYITYDTIGCISDALSRQGYPEIVTFALRFVYRFLQFDIVKCIQLFFSDDFEGVNIICNLTYHLFNAPFKVKQITSYIFTISLSYSPQIFYEYFQIKAEDYENCLDYVKNGFQAISEVFNLSQSDISNLMLIALDSLINVMESRNAIEDFLETINKSGIDEQIREIATMETIEDEIDNEIKERASVLCEKYFGYE